jgi:ABC-type transport system substrate-binding protein
MKTRDEKDHKGLQVKKSEKAIRHERQMNNSFFYLIRPVALSFLIALMALMAFAFSACAKEYDGVWFLGFNLHIKLFGDDNGKLVRRAVATAIDREKIAKKMIGDDAVPVGVIPPGMEGYDPSLTPYPHDYAQAKKLMTNAGYPLYDKRLKQISLLMTDGEKTKLIVDEIKRDLINIGFDITTKVVKYSNTKEWERELMSGRYDMFVMGYKAGTVGEIFIADKTTGIFHKFTCFKNTTNETDQQYFDRYSDAVSSGFSPCTVCNPEPEKAPTTLELLRPLFYRDGIANATNFQNIRVDILIEEVSTLDEKLKASRQDKFEEIGRILHEDLPVVPLFYITRL